MDSFVNKIRSTAWTTVSNFNQILPGNAVTREYEITRPVCSAGPGLIWKVFDAVKKSTREEASVFVFEKKQLDKLRKADRELVLDVLRKGVASLTRLRHPSILIVVHPLEESRDSLAFACESVTASLANILGQRENMPDPIPSDILKYEFYDVEIKYGLLQLSEGLAFLHNDAKMLHRNISPESIVISRKGVWKLAGFDFATPCLNPNDLPIYYPMLNVVNQTCDFPRIALPNLDYVAPEYITESSSPDAKLSSGSDMFSLGALVYTVYSKGKVLLPTGGNVSLLTQRRVDQWKNLPDHTFHCIPEDSRFHVKLLLSIDPYLRPDAHQFNKLNIFEDVLVRTLQYLDSLYQWDNLQKSQFYKGLPEIMSTMPLRVKVNRVIPALIKEFINPDMVPFVLPNFLLVGEEVSETEFISTFLPALVPVFQLKEPIQISIILMTQIEMILSKCKSSSESIKTHILPLVCRCLESDAQQVQELCLKTIPSIAHLIDHNSIKNAILPRVKRLVVSTNLLSVRVTCLLCLGKLLEHMDKWMVIDHILPVLTEIPSKEPAVIMGVIGIYKVALEHNKLGLTKEVMATQVLPYIVPLSIENGLTVNQFTTIMSLIKDMVSKVESEHRVKLEQLNCMKSQHSTMDIMKYTGSSKAMSPSQSSDVLNGTSLKSSPSSDFKSMNLSLEEKERLGRERMSGETKAKQEPKDLTSSLIDSNLSSLTLKPTPPPATQMKLNTMNSPTGNSNHLVSTHRFPLIGSAMSPVSNTFQQPLYQNNANFTVSPQRLTATTSPVYSARPQVNMSAFDSLVIPDLTKPKSQPMNALNRNHLPNTALRPTMSGHQQFGQSGNSSSPMPKLSKAELDELLN